MILYCNVLKIKNIFQCNIVRKIKIILYCNIRKIINIFHCNIVRKMKIILYCNIRKIIHLAGTCLSKNSTKTIVALREPVA
jgi:hypothetical protein